MTLKVDETKSAEYDELITAINDAITKLDDYHTNLDEIMASGNWEGDAHDISVAVYSVVKSYLTGLEGDYEKLKEHVATLITNVDEFTETSEAVKSISA